MTLLTLRFLRVRLRGLTTKANGEYGKGAPIGVPRTEAYGLKETMPSQYNDFPKQTSSLSWEPLGNGKNVYRGGRHWPVRLFHLKVYTTQVELR